MRGADAGADAGTVAVAAVASTVTVAVVASTVAVAVGVVVAGVIMAVATAINRHSMSIRRGHRGRTRAIITTQHGYIPGTNSVGGHDEMNRMCRHVYRRMCGHIGRRAELMGRHINTMGRHIKR